MNSTTDPGRIFSPAILEAQRRYADPDRANRIITAMPDTRRLDDMQRKFIENLPFFFIATSGMEGRLQCNFKGGGPGILHATDETTLYYPEFPGNDLMLSVGNMLANPRIGILAISFEEQRRLKINGRVTLEDTSGHTLQKRWPEARVLVRVAIEEVIRNCSRRIPKLFSAAVSGAEALPHTQGEYNETTV